ncbi:MAG: hypothetical protein JWM89_1800 [Acidimicrobiales bacterium]|nr:hypothetical protein [Acidimicrobiales bacterium]
MANKTAKLQLVIAGDNRGAVKAVDGTTKAVGGLTGSLGGMAGGLAGAFSVGAVGAFAKKTVDTYAKQAAGVAQIKRLTGESAENASLFAFAAQQAGVPIEKVATAAGILATNIQNGKVAANGIATRDGNGNLLDFEQILGNIADKVQSLPAGFQRTDLARKVFGRGGADLVKILQNGSAGIEDLRQKMQDLGLEFNDAGLKKYQDFIKTQRDLQAVITGLQVSLGSKLIPLVTSTEQAFTKLPGPVRETVGTLAVLGAGVGALVLGVGALGPVIARGATALHLKSAAAVESAIATEGAAAAEVLAAEAAAADALAQENLTRAWATGIGVEEASTAAAAAHAAAMEADALATTEVAVASKAGAASTGLFATGLLGVAQMAPLVALGYGDVLKQSDKIIGSEPALTAALSRIGKGTGGVSDALDQLGAGKDPYELFNLDHAHANFKALNASLTAVLQSDGPKVAGNAYDTLSDALHKAGVSTKDINAQFGPFLTTLKASGTAADDGAPKVTKYAQALLDAAGAVEIANHRVAEAEKVFDAQTNLADASATVAADMRDVAAATEAAAGNSDEYRSAVKAEADDLKDLSSAEGDVTDRKHDALKAQQDLNDARAEAVRRLFDLHRAVIETGDDEIAKADAAARAAEEARRKGSDPHATALDKAEAQHQATAAEHAAQAAAQDHTQAILDNAAAQKAGIEGDKQVVAAKEKISEANAAIVDAEQKVREKQAQVAADGVAKSKILQQAAADQRVAQDKLNLAVLAQAQAFRDVETAQHGPVAGLQEYSERLKALYDQLDPNSPLAARIAALLHAVNVAVAFEDNAAAPGVPRLPDGQPIGGPRPRQVKSSSSGTSLGSTTGSEGNIVHNTTNIAITHISQGTSRQVRHAQTAATRSTMNEFFRAGRG